MDMDTTTEYWLKGIVHEEAGMGSSSPSGDQMITCSRPPLMAESRRLRPQHEQALKCPRCDSNHTKFCYYNNYSLSQPRYFCKTCRRYWTKGGSLRNVPVGGGCRKNKRSGCKKLNGDHLMTSGQRPVSVFPDEIDLHLSSFSGLPPLHHHLNSLQETPRGLNFMECKYDGVFESSGEVVDGKFGAMLGNPRSPLFIGGGGSGGDMFGSSSFHGMSPMEFSSMDGSINHGGFMEITCQRLGAIPFEGQYDGRNNNAGHMKPSGNKLLTLEWPEQGCGEIGRDHSFGYSNGMGLWTGLMNDGHGSSTTNPLI